ncbi:hypothetical protein GF362_06245 [Candidatus Dojkabacteria bacterium]|nr:hypothetical protein [Candidatus Dojkabacteria bacterium]
MKKKNKFMGKSKKITKLVPSKNRQRVHVYLNGEYDFSVEKHLIIEFDLYLGKVLSDEEKKEIHLRDVERSLYNKCLRKISRRRHSIKEIRQYLDNKFYKLEREERKEVSDQQQEEIVKNIIRELSESELLDDLKFAESVIESKKKKKSRNEIKQFLIKKRVNSKIIRKALEQSNIQENELIKKLVNKKLRLLEHKQLSNKKKKMKLIQYLARKGFQFNDIYSVIEEMSEFS